MKRTETRTAVIFYDEDHILYIRLRDRMHVDYEDILDNQLVIKTLTEGNKTRKLIKWPGNVRIEKKAQKHLKEADWRSVIAKAVVTDSAMKACIHNFLLACRRSEIPVHFFTDTKKAREWLLKFPL